MATKTISIMDDVYEKLLNAKEDNESFSDVIRRLFSNNYDYTDVIGAWKTMPKKEFLQVKEVTKRTYEGKRFSLD